MHQDTHDTEPRALLIITDDTTKAEIAEAMVFIVQTLQRMPSHLAQRRTDLHVKLDALLSDWEKAQ